MSADLLRRAAMTMRGRARAATPGRWHADKSWGDSVVTDDPATPGDPFVVVTSDYKQDEDILHIASWHPVVALAVADWLDLMAAGIDRTWTGLPESSLPEPYIAALIVARAYLGES